MWSFIGGTNGDKQIVYLPFFNKSENATHVNVMYVNWASFLTQTNAIPSLSAACGAE